MCEDITNLPRHWFLKVIPDVVDANRTHELTSEELKYALSCAHSTICPFRRVRGVQAFKPDRSDATDGPKE